MPGLSLRIPRISGPVMGQPGAAPRQNYLLWSEEWDQPEWVAANATVVADQANDRDGAATADQVAFTSNGRIGQTTSVAAAAGASVATNEALVGTGIERWHVTGQFDGVDWVFAVDLQGAAGAPFTLQITRSGGFLQCNFRDGGDEATFFVSQAMLERGTTPGSYIKREGS